MSLTDWGRVLASSQPPTSAKGRTEVLGVYIHRKYFQEPTSPLHLNRRHSELCQFLILHDAPVEMIMIISKLGAEWISDGTDFHVALSATAGSLKALLLRYQYK